MISHKHAIPIQILHLFLIILLLSFPLEAQPLPVPFSVETGMTLERVISTSGSYITPIHQPDFYRPDNKEIRFDRFRKYHGHYGTFYILDLRKEGKFLNALDYDRIRIETDAHHYTVALADRRLGNQEDNLLVGHDTDELPLAPFYPRLDLQRLRYLILFSEDSITKIRIAFQRRIPAKGEKLLARRGVWSWKRHQLDSGLLRRLEIGKIYLQNGTGFAQAVAKLTQEDPTLQIYALDGSPGDIYHFRELLSKFRRLPLQKLQGIQLDVEPYLLAEYRSHPNEVLKTYLKLLEDVRRWAHAHHLLFSVTIPFWFTQLQIDDRSLAMQIMQRCDEVVVMSYRTDAREILGISRELLRMGELMDKRVALGLELTPIADEIHILYRTMQKTPCINAGYFHENCLTLQRLRRYRIPGERISFYRIPEKLRTLQMSRVDYHSFDGVVFHDYEMLDRFRPFIERMGAELSVSH